MRLPKKTLNGYTLHSEITICHILFSYELGSHISCMRSSTGGYPPQQQGGYPPQNRVHPQQQHGGYPRQQQGGGYPQQQQRGYPQQQQQHGHTTVVVQGGGGGGYGGRGDDNDFATGKPVLNTLMQLTTLKLCSIVTSVLIVTHQSSQRESYELLCCLL